MTGTRKKSAKPEVQAEADAANRGGAVKPGSRTSSVDEDGQVFEGRKRTQGSNGDENNKGP